MKGKRKNGGPRGCRAADTNFPKERKNKRMKRTKKKQRSMFSMHLDFYKISLGYFQTRSKSLSRALLQFIITIRTYQHTTHWNLVATMANLLPSSSICDNSALMMLLFTLIGVIMRWFGNLSAYKLPKITLVFLTLCFTLVGVIIRHL